MERIIIHWSGGGHKANGTDRRAYHYIIEGDGNVVDGNHPPEANAHISNPKDGSTYAAHTRGLNTGSIGVALAAMRGAQERPFSAGPSPITEAQLDALARLCAGLCTRYGIPVQRDTVLTHAEVQPTLKVAQRQKWDVTWLPGMSGVGDPVTIGDGLRYRITAALTRSAPPVASRPTAAPAPSGGLLSLVMSLFGGRK